MRLKVYFTADHWPYRAGTWYDNVPQEHVDAAGADAEVAIESDCGCLLIAAGAVRKGYNCPQGHTEV